MDYQELLKEMSKQKEEMTDNERTKAYLEGKEVDYLPFRLHAPVFCYASLYGYKSSEYAKSFDAKVDVIKRLRDEFGIYNYSAGLGLKTIGAALGSKRLMPLDGFDYIEEHILKDNKDIDKLEVVDPYTNPVLKGALETAKRIKDMFPDIPMSTSLAGPITTAISIRPIESVLKDTRRDFENYEKLLNLAVECNLAWFKAFKAEIGETPVNFSDPVACMDILSKKQFDKISLPFMRKQVEGMTKIVGRYPTSHICGHTKEIWQDLKELGITSFGVDNCEDLREIKEALGDSMVISGNVPPVDVIKNGSIDDIIESVKESILKCADSPMGYILSTGCQVPMGVPRRNVDAFIYAARKYGKGARKGKIPEGVLNYI